MIASKDGHDDALQTAAQSLLLLSIGNTRVAIGGWANGQRGHVCHVPAGASDGLGDEVRHHWEALPQGPRAVVISSVNPPCLEIVRRTCEEAGIGPVLVVGDNLPLPMAVDLPEPDRVGTDRICVAAAAYARMKSACVVADLGTAVTIDLVGDDGMFLGGTILPGMALSAKALHEYTELLPLVEVGSPSETLGRDTVSAIRNGIFAMMAGALREITERYASEVGKWPPLILTGGDAAAIARSCDFVDRVAPDLIMDGLVLAYRLSFPDTTE